jgi:hypothetical protein
VKGKGKEGGVPNFQELIATKNFISTNEVDNNLVLKEIPLEVLSSIIQQNYPFFKICRKEEGISIFEGRRRRKKGKSFSKNLWKQKNVISTSEVDNKLILKAVPIQLSSSIMQQKHPFFDICWTLM